MNLLEQLINASGEIVIISKDVNDNYMVHFEHCDVYKNPGALGEAGRGKTVDAAVKDYVKKISGKKLVFNYGTDSERFATFIILIEENGDA